MARRSVEILGQIRFSVKCVPTATPSPGLSGVFVSVEGVEQESAAVMSRQLYSRELELTTKRDLLSKSHRRSTVDRAQNGDKKKSANLLRGGGDG